MLIMFWKCYGMIYDCLELVLSVLNMFQVIYLCYHDISPMLRHWSKGHSRDYFVFGVTTLASQCRDIDSVYLVLTRINPDRPLIEAKL